MHLHALHMMLSTTNQCPVSNRHVNLRLKQNKIIKNFRNELVNSTWTVDPNVLHLFCLSLSLSPSLSPASFSRICLAISYWLFESPFSVEFPCKFRNEVRSKLTWNERNVNIFLFKFAICNNFPQQNVFTLQIPFASLIYGWWFGPCPSRHISQNRPTIRQTLIIWICEQFYSVSFFFCGIFIYKQLIDFSSVKAVTLHLFFCTLHCIVSWFPNPFCSDWHIICFIFLACDGKTKLSFEMSELVLRLVFTRWTSNISNLTSNSA